MNGPAADGRKLSRSFGRLALLGTLLVIAGAALLFDGLGLIAVGVGGRRVVTMVSDRLDAPGTGAEGLAKPPESGRK